MKNWLAMGAVSLVLVGVATVGAFEEKTPSIKSVMTKLHKGPKAEFSVLKTQVEAETPDWDAISKTTEDFVTLGAALGKNDPPKGEKDSWKKLSAKYLKDAEALDEAAEAKDLDKLKAAQKAMGASCKACHTPHRGK
ncbi:cytochrome c [Tundrisphaera lichenicola]|uniref:cytochrome c n=1 Tax=Tundrisphaera lichenicola TaxID=2029860 RepID=UPI003EB77858